MEPQSTRLIAFSPTGTTRAVIREVGLGLGLPTCELDLTRPSVSETTLSASERVVVGVPVWAGRVPAIARERLARVRGAGNPAVLIACYGNRAFDDALVELWDLANEQGLVPMAAAAFVCEHSFSSPATPHRRRQTRRGRPRSRQGVRAPVPAEAPRSDHLARRPGQPPVQAAPRAHLKAARARPWPLHPLRDLRPPLPDRRAEPRRHPPDRLHHLHLLLRLHQGLPAEGPVPR